MFSHQFSHAALYVPSGGGSTPPTKSYDVGRWNGGVIGSLNPGTAYAAPNGLFPTEARNDNSSYSWNSSTSTLTLPSSNLADGYLVVAGFEFEDSSNGRFNPVGKFVHASGTGNFVTAESSGYSRDTSEDRAYVRTWCFIDNPSASATLQFQWRRDGDAPNAADGTVRSEIQVIPLYYSNHGIYSTAASSAYGGVTPNQVTGWSSVSESDTAAIELSSNQFIVKGDNKTYLVLGSWFGSGGGSRTQRWGGLYSGSDMIRSAMSYAYQRNGSNEYTGNMFTHLIGTGIPDETFDLRIYRGDGISSGQGGADVDGSWTSDACSLVILELNDTAEAFHTVDDTGNQNLATPGPIDINVSRSTGVTFNDSASFTRASDTAMNVVGSGDVILGGNVSAASNVVSSGARFTAFSEFTINGSEDSNSVAGNYMRNNQGSQDTFGWSANLLSVHAVSDGDDVGISVTELTGGEGGGNNVRANANWVGFWGIKLDSL